MRRVKLGIEQNGETKYLSHLALHGNTISYQLSAEGQVLSSEELAAIIGPLQASKDAGKIFITDVDVV